jgi:Thioredoxin
MGAMNGHLCRITLSLSVALALAWPAAAQFSNPETSTTQVHNSAPLRPPAGARVAIVEWEDLECPDCARANVILAEAVEKYHIPWVRHDFPLPFHAWSFQAAVDARWFDTRSKKLGDAFRDAVFAAQPSIHNQEDLRQFAVSFAERRHLRFPMVVDPHGGLAALVKADFALGKSVGILHTPTIWVVTNRKSSAPFVEVVDRTRLFSMIDEAERQTARER